MLYGLSSGIISDYLDQEIPLENAQSTRHARSGFITNMAPYLKFIFVIKSRIYEKKMFLLG